MGDIRGGPGSELMIYGICHLISNSMLVLGRVPLEALDIGSTLLGVSRQELIKVLGWSVRFSDMLLRDVWDTEHIS
jgi:hypothetical protein